MPYLFFSFSFSFFFFAVPLYLLAYCLEELMRVYRGSVNSQGSLLLVRAAVAQDRGKVKVQVRICDTSQVHWEPVSLLSCYR